MSQSEFAARAAADNDPLATAHGEAIVEAEDPEIAGLERELAAAMEAAAEAEAKRERERRGAVLREQIAEAKRHAREEEALAEAEKKYGAIGKSIEPVETIDGLVIVHVKDMIKVRRWQDQYGDKPTTENLRQLARPCVVHPDLGEFDQLIARRPVALVSVATAVLKLSGLRVRELGGK
jgi:hypothetical protein